VTVFMVVYTYRQDAAGREHVRDAHVEFLRELAEQGVNLLSGPLDDGSSSGMQLMRSDSAQGLTELLSRDPYAVHGFLTSTQVHEWKPMLGWLTSYVDPAGGPR
jgi:uncharacterized protein YciI